MSSAAVVRVVAVIAAVLAISACSYTGETTWELGGTTPDGQRLFVSYDAGGGLRDISVTENDQTVTVNVSVRRVVGPQSMDLNIGHGLIKLDQPLGDRELRGCGRDSCRASDMSGLTPAAGELTLLEERVRVSTGGHEAVLDAATGAPSSDTGGVASQPGTEAHQPRVLDGTATVRTESTGLFVENVDTGEPVLIKSLLPTTQPVVSGNLVILGVSSDSADADAGTTLDAYDAATGDLKWQIPLPDTQGIAASGGLVFYLDGTQIVALNATTGETRYRAEAFMPVGDVTVDRSRAYVSLWHGAAAFAVQNGSLIWWWQQDAGLVHQP